MYRSCTLVLHKLVIIVFCLIGLFVSLTTSTTAQGGVQVFGEYHYGSFIGVYSYVTMNNGSNTDGHYTAGPSRAKR